MKTKTIYCCTCKTDVIARATNGAETYPAREDLHDLKFFVCDKCLNFVGCHKNDGNPLGVIPTKDFKMKRRQIHTFIDDLWKNENNTKDARDKVYRAMRHLMKLNRPYHTADLRTEEEHSLALKSAQYLFHNFKYGNEKYF